LTVQRMSPLHSKKIPSTRNNHPASFISESPPH
jgi:hypothetical protein